MDTLDVAACTVGGAQLPPWGGMPYWVFPGSPTKPSRVLLPHCVLLEGLAQDRRQEEELHLGASFPKKWKGLEIWGNWSD